MTALLKVEGLKKAFGGVVALRDASFELEAGTVHALCGGNGAGKSTFLSILMGIYRRDAGKIWRKGQEVEFNSPAEALASGIAIIEQELSPIPQMTVAENIFLGREPPGRFGGVNFRKMNAAAQAILDDLGFVIPATRRMASLSVAQMQLVEIAKALSHDAEVIFMDEPTSAIGHREAHQLFTVVRRLREQGRGIVYVSHRLSEIFDIADRYTVFRDGGYVGSGLLADVDRASLIRMIVGREISEEYEKVNKPTDEEGLSVVGLTSPGKISDISFTVRKGEIFGIYGLMGSGRSEIFDCLFGLDKPSSGEVKLFGEPLSVATPAQAIARGIALVTEDRKLSGLYLSDSVRRNLSMASLRALSPHFVVNGGARSQGEPRGDRAVPHSCRPRRRSRLQPLGRQPAKSRAGQMVSVQSARAAARRTDAGRRRRREARDLAHRRRFRRGGRHGCDDLFGNRRTPRRRRPHHGHARWPVGRDPRSIGSDCRKTRSPFSLENIQEIERKSCWITCQSPKASRPRPPRR